MDGSPAGPAAAIGLHVVTDDGNRCGCDAYDGLWMPSSACSNRREGGGGALLAAATATFVPTARRRIRLAVCSLF